MNERKIWGWTIEGRPAPQPDDDPKAYRWWRRGATDEHFLAIEGVSEENQQLLEVLRGLSRLGRFTNEELVQSLMRIYFGEGRWVFTAELPTQTNEATLATEPEDASSCSTSLGTASRPPADTAG